ncbi:MAG: cupredoxin domain-containing protein [Armatimonadota bacterium]|nr:cupredoxin domain-containing protein [Armatimonadota bacterium]MDR7440507.1 cupredoxin domain-containing protein [Armatimonadota bacterium]MDR7563796.1 cupredoxin domain-containing protein [Armatimonadota bacterium]MDR7568770.1 cupredoxin domain-containing protein [Armatimonadota bacterium]MDR7602585.1 cupredoxin domain-containing protein [Armatimonadota bacterium]
MEALDRVLLRYTWFVALLTLAGVVAVAAQLRAQREQIGTPPAPQPTPAVQRVEVTLREFKFEPAHLEVPAGRVVLVIRNEGLIPHDLSIPGLGKKTEYIAPKKEATLELDLRPGTYPFECTVSGHKEAGMQGTLVVQ